MANTGMVIIEYSRQEYGSSRKAVQKEVTKYVEDSANLVGYQRASLATSTPAAKSLRRPNQGVTTGESGFITWGEQPCSISVIGADGKPVKAMRQGVGKQGGDSADSAVYTDFLLTAVRTSVAEKSQIVETFGEAFMYFFGQSVQVLQCDAMLINTVDYPWVHEWVYNYDNVLRGSKLLERGARAYLAIGLDVYEGYFATYNTMRAAEDEYKVPLSFAFYVTNIIRVADALWGSWYDTLVAPEMHIPVEVEKDPLVASGMYTPEAEKDSLGIAIAKAITRTAISESWGFITSPSNVANMNSPTVWENFGIKAGTAVGLSAFDTVLEGAAEGVTGSGIQLDSVLGVATHLAQVALGDPRSKTAWAGVGTGVASRVMHGLMTEPSVFDSNGNILAIKHDRLDGILPTGRLADGNESWAAGATANIPRKGWIPGPGAW